MTYLVLHTNGFYIILVLSVVNQKMKAYLQELILGTFTVTFFIEFNMDMPVGVRLKHRTDFLLVSPYNVSDKLLQIGNLNLFGSKGE